MRLEDLSRFRFLGLMLSKKECSFGRGALLGLPFVFVAVVGEEEEEEGKTAGSVNDLLRAVRVDAPAFGGTGGAGEPFGESTSMSFVLVLIEEVDGKTSGSPSMSKSIAALILFTARAHRRHSGTQSLSERDVALPVTGRRGTRLLALSF